MSSFSMASLSCSDGPCWGVEQSDAKHVNQQQHLEKWPFSFSLMISHMRDLDFSEAMEIHCVWIESALKCQHWAGSLSSWKKWKNSQIRTCNIYLRLLHHITELVVNEKQNSNQKNSHSPISSSISCLRSTNLLIAAEFSDYVNNDDVCGNVTTQTIECSIDKLD